MKERFTSKILLGICIICTCCLQAQTWAWRVPVGQSRKLLKDNANEVYSWYNPSGQFILEKYSTNGSMAWSKTMNGQVSIKSVRLDAANNLVVLGNLTGQATVDNYTLTPTGSSSFFILKISSASAVTSANVYGNSGAVVANSLYVTSAGDFLIGGAFTGTFSINSTAINGDAFQNGFLVKTTSAENVLWWEKTTLYTNSGAASIDEVAETTGGNYFVEITMTGGLADFKGYQFGGSGQYLNYMNAARQIQSNFYIGYPGISFFNPWQLETYGEAAYMKDIYTHQSLSANINRWNSACADTATGWIATSLGYCISGGKVFAAILEQNSYNNTSKWWRKFVILTPGLGIIRQYVDTLASAGNYYDIQAIDTSGAYVSGTEPGYGTFIGKFIFGQPLGVQENTNEESSVIYPNPSSGYLTVSQPGNTSTHVKIYDNLGTLVMQKEINATEQLDVGSLPPAIYTIECRSGSLTSHSRFIKE